MSKLTFIERFPGNDSEDERDDDVESKDYDKDDKPIDLQIPIKISKYSSTPNDSNKNDIANSKKVSSGLQKFLQQKRTNRIEPPPDIIETNDTYLKEFHGTFIKPSNISDNDEEEDKNNQGNLSINISSSTTQSSKTELKLPKLKLFNLLFRITENELIKFGREYGYEFQNVTLGIDSATNLPTGAAVVYLPIGTDVTECVMAINGQDCCGRPIRALSDSGYVKSRDSLGGGGNANRYFEKDISFKCNNCQLVGHKSSECSNPASKQPCHLCASFDHEASDCQNIVCFRCNQFGHHSKFCTQNYRSNTTQKPILCTICGQTNSHEKTVCPILSHKFKFEKYKSSSINNKNSSINGSNNSGHVIYHTSESLKRNRDDDNDNNDDDGSSTTAAMSVYKDAEYDALKSAAYKLLEGTSSTTSSNNTATATNTHQGKGKVSSNKNSSNSNSNSNSSSDDSVIEGIICMTCLTHHGTACCHINTSTTDFSSRTSSMNGSANSSISTNSSMDISSDDNNNNKSTNHASKKLKLSNNNNNNNSNDNKSTSTGNNSMNNSKNSNTQNNNSAKLTTATATIPVAVEYCPNCGCQNHHCDYPVFGEYNMCNAPKYEAYQRFNRLLDELVDPQHGGAEDDQNFQLYRTLTRYQNEAVIQHFPCLQKPLPLPKSSSAVSSSNYNNSTNIVSSSTVSSKSMISNTSSNSNSHSNNYNNSGIIRVVHNDNISNNNNSSHNRNGNSNNYSTTSSVRNSHHVRYNNNNDDDDDNDDNVYGDNYNNNNNRSSYNSNYNTNNRVFNNSYNNSSSSPFASLPLPVPKVQHHHNTQSQQRKFPQQQQQRNGSNSSYGRSVQFSR